MAFSVDPLTYIISVPQADLTFVSGTLYNHDTEAFRLELKSWEDSAEGIVQPKTHDHNTTVEIVGTTYARSIKILAPYSIEYEDGQYTVVLLGSNNNIFDVAGGILVQNQVQVIPTNSAGLIVGTGGGGSSVWTEAEKNQIIADVNLIESKLPTDGLEISSYQQVADAGLTAPQAAQLQAIFDKLPADNGDMPSLANVNNLIGAGLSTGQATQLLTIFNTLPVTGQIANEANVAALIGQGLTAPQAGQLLAIFDKLPLTGLIANQADVSALSGDGLTAGQIAQLQAVFDVLPVSGLIASDANVTALIGQGLTTSESSWLLGIFNRLPNASQKIAGVDDVVGVGLTPTESAQLQAIVDKLPAGIEIIASADDVAAIDSPWTTGEKDQLITDLETTKRQALKGANNTEAPN